MYLNSLSTIVVTILLFILSVFAFDVFDDKKADQISRLSLFLPNLNYSVSEAIWAKLKNGFLDNDQKSNSNVVSARMLPNPLIFTDLNNDGIQDAIVVVQMIFPGPSGYFNLYIFPVLMGSNKEPIVQPHSGFQVGVTSIFPLYSFDWKEDPKELHIAFMDRRPEDPKVVKPSIPTILTLSFDSANNKFKEVSKKILAPECFQTAFQQ